MKRILITLIGLLLYVSGYTQELRKFSADGKFGFRDEYGNIVVPAKYDEIGSFSEGLAGVRINRKWGYIDKTGNEVISPKYYAAESFFEGFAKVVEPLPSPFGFRNPFVFDYIDKTGTEMFKPVLVPYIEQADRLSRRGNKGGNFKIKTPYLIVSKEEGLINILKYSEGNIDAQMMNRVKTLIVIYNYLESTRTYDAFGRDYITRSTYGKKLIYFDMDTKKHTGRDKINARPLPQSFTTTDRQIELGGVYHTVTFGNGDFYIPFDEVIKYVEYHLATPTK